MKEHVNFFLLSFDRSKRSWDLLVSDPWKRSLWSKFWDHKRSLRSITYKALTCVDYTVLDVRHHQPTPVLMVTGTLTSYKLIFYTKTIPHFNAKKTCAYACGKESFHHKPTKWSKFFWEWEYTENILHCGKRSKVNFWCIPTRHHKLTK